MCCFITSCTNCRTNCCARLLCNYLQLLLLHSKLHNINNSCRMRSKSILLTNSLAASKAIPKSRCKAKLHVISQIVLRSENIASQFLCLFRKLCLKNDAERSKRGLIIPTNLSFAGQRGLISAAKDS